MAAVAGLDAVLVPVGRETYAVPTGWVREVVMAPRLTPLVTASAAVLGLFNLRGEIVPVLDTSSLVGLGRRGSVEFVVVLETHFGPVGIGATAVPRRVILSTLLGPSDLPGTAGSYRVGNDVAILLDVEAALESSNPSSGDLAAADARGPALSRRA